MLQLKLGVCYFQAFFHCLDFDSLPNLDPGFENRTWAGDDRTIVRCLAPICKLRIIYVHCMRIHTYAAGSRTISWFLLLCEKTLMLRPC